MDPFGVQKFRRLVFVGTFSVLAEFLMGFFGTVLSGRYLGEAAMTGVALLSPLFTAVIFVSGLFGVGMGVTYAREMGCGDRLGAHRVFTQAVWSVLSVGTLLALAVAFGSGAFLAYLNPSPDVAAYAQAYLRWFVPVAVLEPAVVLLLNCCYADGDDVLCYAAYGTQLGVNLAVSCVALRMGLGVSACALGMVSGFAVALAILLLHFRREANSFRLVRHFRLADTGRIVGASLGDASGFLCDALLFFWLSKFFLSRFGAAELPVLGVIISTLGLLELTNGVGVAAQPIVAVYEGERNTRGIRRVMQAALRFSVCEGGFLALLVLVAPDLVLRLLGVADSPLAGDARCALRIVSMGFVCSAVSNLLNGYYIVIGREALAVSYTYWGWLVVPVLSVWAMSSAFGLGGVWLGLGVAPPLMLGGFGAAYALFRRWRGGPRWPLLLSDRRDVNIHMLDLALSPRSVVAASQNVAALLRTSGASTALALRAQLLTEEVLMSVKDQNGDRRVLAEVTVDVNDGVQVTLRDDGRIFDITDTDAQVSSLRRYLVAQFMGRQEDRLNLITTGFNRNVFRLQDEPIESEDVPCSSTVPSAASSK